jgi:hypothetical protein
MRDSDLSETIKRIAGQDLPKAAALLTVRLSTLLGLYY